MKSQIAALTAALLCIATITNAQTIDKGSNFISGSISFNKRSSVPNSEINSATTDNTSSFINLKYGKFISNNNVLGVIGIFGPSKSELKSHSTNSDGSRYTHTINTSGRVIGSGIFYRKYFEILDRFYFFGEADALYSHTKIKSTNAGPSSTVKDTLIQNSFDMGITPGLTYRIFKKLHFDISLPDIANIYYSTAKSNAGKYKDYGFRSSLGYQFLEHTNFGLTLVF